MSRQMRVCALILVFALLLAGCGGDSSSQDSGGDSATAVPSDTESPDAIEAYGLEPGTYKLTVSGPFNGDTTTQDEVVPARFEPNAFADNETGEMRLQMVVRGYLPDSEDIYNDLTVTMVLAGGISAGTYNLGEANGDVTAVVESGFGPYSSNVSGSVTLDFVNHRWINGSFEFAGENANAEAMGMAGALEASGAFHQIPFTPGQEHDVRISGAVVENLEGSSVLRIGNDFSMAFIGVDIRLTMQFNADPAAETYDVTADDLPFTLAFEGIEAEAVSGTVTFEDDEEYLNGSLDLTLQTPDGEAQVSGTFNYFPRP